MLADEVPFVAVQLGRLVEDGVRDPHLADVVELRGAHDLVDVLARHAQPPRDEQSELADVAGVLRQARLACLDDSHQHVLGLLARAGTTAALVRVHPLVGKLQRVVGVGRLVREEHRAAGRADRESFARLGEGADGSRDGRLQLLRHDLQQDTELIAAEAVGAALHLHRRGQLGAQPGQQRVAGGVPERVVVVLEAVEVEQQEHARCARPRVCQVAAEVGRQLAAVAELRQRVRHRLLAQRLVGDDVGGGAPRAVDEPG